MKSKAYKHLFPSIFMLVDSLEVVQGGKALNSRLISLHRLLLLSALASLGQDGASYRELKAALDMEDGILYSNLKVLQEMEYVKFVTNNELNRELEIIVITKEGKDALVKVQAWLKKIVETKVI